MMKSMKNTYVRVNTYGGIDWHDASSHSNFLQEDGRFEIKDVGKAIAAYVYEGLKNMSISSSSSEHKTVLENIPPLEEIIDCVLHKNIG